ncbi:hypothetical protein [Kutzneria sp. 744]|uniref:hypothetical protein n=1 Tax=Kutzneria sp. (strain 744) TaxID=345341 RepID=UPI0018DB3B2E|nr:hypothetical protein [Kutzneria sp. 744]
MRIRDRRRAIMLSAVGLAVASVLASVVPQAAASATGGDHPSDAGTGATTGTLPVSKTILPSAIKVDLQNEYVRLPLHKGDYKGRTVWYVLTEASDQGAADDLGLNYAPKLANASVGCPSCVQDVTLTGGANAIFNEATIHFAGVPDFSPSRVLTAGPTGFPPSQATPGAVGGPGYSPFIRVAGSPIVYNAPIVAVGDGPFDVDHHTNTADRVLAVHPAAKDTGPAQFHGASVDLLFIRGFDSGKSIIYISTDASDATTAVLERATYVPALNNVAFPGGDDFLGSARERIFPFVNGQTGANNPQAQGLSHLILDGHAGEDASLGDKALLQALSHGGDALNIQGDFPTLKQNNRRDAYSPLWEAQFGEWTQKAVQQKLNTRQTDEFQILKLAAEHPDLLTAPGGAPYGSVKALIDCPVIGYLTTEPQEDLIQPAPGSAVDFSGAYFQG